MFEGRDELAVMQDDLRRALKKDNPQWTMLIDTRRCMLCHACTLGCTVEYKSPPGVRYRPMYEVEKGKYPKVQRLFVARPCLQCDAPPCVQACPLPGEGGATWKGKDGIVMINYHKCIGCGRCVTACPYSARNLDKGAFYTDDTPEIPAMERGPVWEYDGKWYREGKKLPVGKARKCQFCFHRLKTGALPVCVATCIGRATYFGDRDDPVSLLSKVMKTGKTTTLKEVEGAGKVAAAVAAAGFRLSSTEWKSALGQAVRIYPGIKPVFGASVTKPRVFYIV